MIPAQIARIDKIMFLFLSLPPELQTEVLNNLRNYSDLKALRLVSKQLSGIATPLLYYELDLRTVAKGHDACRMRQRINSLLLQPENLLFVRILKTPSLGQEESQLMGQLIPLLKQDSLTRFKFSALSKKRFPTPTQMIFIWNHQKKLQNQKLYWYMAPSLEAILEERGPSEGGLVKSFTMLDIDVQYRDYRTQRSLDTIKDIISRPLKILDLSILQKLRIYGVSSGSVILPRLNTLFANGSFINLRKLSISNVIFGETLRLTKLPSLKSLALQESSSADFHIVPFVLANDIRLSTFSSKAFGSMEEMTPLLAQIKGLESLQINCIHETISPIRAQQEFANAIISNNQDTLSVLHLKLKLQGLTTLFNSYIWEYYITKDIIQSCKTLVTLSLPRIEMSVNSYCELIAALPNLETLTIYGPATRYEDWGQDDLELLISASTGNLKAIIFESSRSSPSSEVWEIL